MHNAPPLLQTLRKSQEELEREQELLQQKDEQFVQVLQKASEAAAPAMRQHAFQQHALEGIAESTGSMAANRGNQKTRKPRRRRRMTEKEQAESKRAPRGKVTIQDLTQVLAALSSREDTLETIAEKASLPLDTVQRIQKEVWPFFDAVTLHKQRGVPVRAIHTRSSDDLFTQDSAAWFQQGVDAPTAATAVDSHALDEETMAAAHGDPKEIEMLRSAQRDLSKLMK
ncbi:MAG: hypothetical protein MHM6MM_004852 [Cercozoa sp. M6MM]